MTTRRKSAAKPLPCPCCGESGKMRNNPMYDDLFEQAKTDKALHTALLMTSTRDMNLRPMLGLHAGEQGHAVYGVKCYTCGLAMFREIGEGLNSGKAAVAAALKAWNTRA